MGTRKSTTTVTTKKPRGNKNANKYDAPCKFKGERSVKAAFKEQGVTGVDFNPNEKKSTIMNFAIGSIKGMVSENATKLLRPFVNKGDNKGLAAALKKISVAVMMPQEKDETTGELSPRLRENPFTGVIEPVEINILMMKSKEYKWTFDIDINDL